VQLSAAKSKFKSGIYLLLYCYWPDGLIAIIALLLYTIPMNWTIKYYMTSDGKCPVKEFIDLLSAESKAKFVFIADLLEEYGLKVKEPYVKPITGSRKLFEIRIKCNLGRYFIGKKQHYFTLMSMDYLRQNPH